MKKAQAAMEFLMTYGWAILVVLIAIGALAYFGVLKPEQFLPEKCVISTGSGLFCEDFAIDDEDTVRVYIHNILPNDLTDVAVTLKNAGTDTGTCSGTLATLDADATDVVTLACTTSLSDKVKADLSIAYTVDKDGTDIDKTTTGTLTSRVPPTT